MVGVYPVGGVAWDYLQYVLGLSNLGHDVYYFEDTWRRPYNPAENQYVDDGFYSAKFIGNFFKAYAPELSGKWYYFHMKEKGFGMDKAEFENVSRTADLFLNISGACFIPETLSERCLKIFIDTDPGYNQIMISERPKWSENIERWCSSVSYHDQHFTYAENIHSEDCIIPKVRFDWKTTRMPIAVDFWNHFSDKGPYENAPWTTVLSWNEFNGKVIYEGIEYKGKGHEFGKILELPRNTKSPIKIAVGGENAPRELLRRYGWEVIDGPKATLSPKLYQGFIAGSRGEISVAKHVYVAMRSGWFSCRSACYLAAGRPVITQDTGFGKFIPTGEGLFSFKTIEDILTAFDTINSDYKKHSLTALATANEYFRADKILAKLIADLGL